MVIETTEGFVEWANHYLKHNPRRRNRKFHLAQDGHMTGTSVEMVPSFILMWVGKDCTSSIRLTTEVYNSIAPLYKQVPTSKAVFYDGSFTLRQIWEFLL